MSHVLFVCSHAETVDFLFGEVAPIATTDVLLSETSKLYTVELDDLIAEALEDAADNAVLARVDFNAHLLLVDGVSILDVVGLDLAVLKLNTLGNLLEVVGRDILIEIDVINLLLEVLRMG